CSLKDHPGLPGASKYPVGRSAGGEGQTPGAKVGGVLWWAGVLDFSEVAMVVRSCRKCGREHPVFYFVNVKQRHLGAICGRSWIYLPYEEGLDVVVRYSKSGQPKQRKAR